MGKNKKRKIQIKIEELDSKYLPCNCRFEGAEVGKVIVIKKNNYAIPIAKKKPAKPSAGFIGRE